MTLEESLSTDDPFFALYTQLFGREPMDWHRGLFTQIGLGAPPPTVEIDESLDVEGVLPCWLIAKMLRPQVVPTRLVWTLPKDATVAAASAVARRMAVSRPADATGLDFDIRSTLSPLVGRSWLAMDPTKPTIVVGTTDEIGHALAFREHRGSIESRPTAAGLLGVDAYHVVVTGYRRENAYVQFLDQVANYATWADDAEKAPVRQLWKTVIQS